MELLKDIMGANFLYSVIRLTTPIIFATLSAVISVKAGVVNIAIEGMMLIVALTSVIISSMTQSVPITLQHP